MDSSVVIRPMVESDLDSATRAHRLAFGTFFGLPDPTTFRGDAQPVRSRFATDSRAALVAELENRVVGSGYGADWGSLCIIGPVTVHPNLWGRGIARRLMDGLIGIIAARPGVTLTGLLTHAQSPKHIRL
ncbi:MAG: GNAT family N-acetyltransferase, partial [Alphaproteobacteria bacterium]|nr:GNAT family N-acetyltransferase [Alphaproteobacteria bacterium]